MFAGGLAIAVGDAGTAGPSFNPISRNPVLLFDANKGISIGTGVSAWQSQGSNTLSVTQGTGADQPGYTASNASWGNQSTLNYTSTSMQLSNSFTLAQPFTIYVFGAITTASTSFFVECTDALGLDLTKFYFNDGAINSSSVGDGNPHAFCAVFDGTSGGLYVDSSSAAIVAGSDTVGLSSTLSVGALMTGTIAFVMIVANADTQAQRSQLFTYGSSRYKAFTAQ